MQPYFRRRPRRPYLKVFVPLALWFPQLLIQHSHLQKLQVFPDAASLDLFTPCIHAGSKTQLGEEAAKPSNTDICPLYHDGVFSGNLSAASFPLLCSGRHAAAVTCRNFAGTYKLWDLEAGIVATLPGSLDTPKLKAKLPLPSDRPQFPPEGFKGQHAMVLARELLGRFIPWPF